MTFLSSDTRLFEHLTASKRSTLLSVKPILFCLLAFALSRIALLAIGYLAYTGQLLLPISPDQAMNKVLGNPLLDMWFAWDSNWYLTVLVEGYQATAGAEAGAGFKQANWAFFPLYPWISGILAFVSGLSGPASLVAIANIAFFLALCLVYAEMRDLADERAARLAVILLLIWPGTHFFSSAYTEALFLLFVVLTFRLARQKRFLGASILAAMATLTRSPGIMLVFPIAIYAWMAWAEKNNRPLNAGSGLTFTFGKSGARTFAICCIPAVALIGFMAHLHVVAGDAFAFASVQEAWGRGFRNPLMEFARPFLAPSTIPAGQWPDYITMWLLPVPLWMLWRQGNRPHFVFALILFLLAITAGVVSLNRQMLVVFPIVAVVAVALAQSTLMARAFIPLASLGALTLMAFWAAGYGVV
ncbi:MAG: glycosyltransferase family 39 protein [Pseudomonadota bacterium]